MMDKVTKLAVAILSVWRLTSLLHRERGPADIFMKFRQLLGVRYDGTSQPYATTNVSEGVLCFWCCSVWVAVVVAVWAVLVGELRWRDAPQLVLATSAGAILVDEALP